MRRAPQGADGAPVLVEVPAPADEARVRRPFEAAGCTDCIAFGPRIGPKVLTVHGAERGLLASSEFPEACFVAWRFRFEGANLAELRGEFTLQGISQPLPLVGDRVRLLVQVQGRCKSRRPRRTGLLRGSLQHPKLKLL